jgi:hypothetical protein
MHSVFQCSTATKSQPQPSSTVETLAPSVPHMTLAAWVMITPAWRLGWPRRLRWGERRWFSRMSRNFGGGLP